jgi:hypothetical protein
VTRERLQRRMLRVLVGAQVLSGLGGSAAAAQSSGSVALMLGQRSSSSERESATSRQGARYALAAAAPSVCLMA